MCTLGANKQPRTTKPLRLTEMHMVVVCTYKERLYSSVLECKALSHISSVYIRDTFPESSEFRMLKEPLLRIFKHYLWPRKFEFSSLVCFLSFFCIKKFQQNNEVSLFNYKISIFSDQIFISQTWVTLMFIYI